MNGGQPWPSIPPPATRMAARALEATGTLDAATIDRVADEAGREAADQIARRLTREQDTP